MRIRRLRIQLQTTQGLYGTTLDFPDGLVVVWADNSMGKSTCVKAILVALGMEAMLTTTQADLPLPPALKARLESETGEHGVVESEVLLEIENSKGERIVVQRVIKGSRDKNLITVHEGPVLTVPDRPCASKDYFVSRAGAATRETGFHYYLTKFLGWDLPLVQTYDGNEYPLYLQCIVPYFVVEQTRGWSTIQPPLPTQFRIREAHKRSVEFLLNLDAHRNALKRQEIQFEKNKIESEWSTLITRIRDLAEQSAARVQGLPTKPIASWPPTVLPVLVVPDSDNWIPMGIRRESRQQQFNILVQQEIPRVQEIATAAQIELTRTEELVRDRQTLLSRLLDSLEAEEQEAKRIEERLRAIDEDIQHNKDVRTLKRLGSRQGSAVNQGSCPVCHQEIQDSLLPLEDGQAVMSLDESIEFLSEQKRTYEVVLANARAVSDARALQVRTLRDELSTLRSAVRALRQTLVSDGRLPSQAAIQARMELESAIKKDQEVEDRFNRLIGSFESLAERWKLAQVASDALPKEDLSQKDKEKVDSWARLMREQLVQYGFGSFPPGQVLISKDTYRPEHEGFDLETSFSLQNSISASDLIRTIWSYLNGLLELARIEETNHPGFILFDEPRQQSTRDVSFSELLKRSSSSIEFGQQVIFFTSENRARLDAHLEGLQYTLNAIEGRVLKPL